MSSHDTCCPITVSLDDALSSLALEKGWGKNWRSYFPNPHQKVKTSRIIMNEENSALPPTKQKSNHSHTEGCSLLRVKRNKQIEPTSHGKAGLWTWAYWWHVLQWLRLLQFYFSTPFNPNGWKCLYPNIHLEKLVLILFSGRCICHWCNTLALFFK